MRPLSAPKNHHKPSKYHEISKIQWWCSYDQSLYSRLDILGDSSGIAPVQGPCPSRSCRWFLGAGNGSILPAPWQDNRWNCPCVSFFGLKQWWPTGKLRLLSLLSCMVIPLQLKGVKESGDEISQELDLYLSCRCSAS